MRQSKKDASRRRFRQDFVTAEANRTACGDGSGQSTPRGAIPTIERVEYDLARFSMPSSRDQVVLQAADLLVWTAQREARSDGLKAAQRRLVERTSDHLVSRAMSEMIVAARVRQSEVAVRSWAAHDAAARKAVRAIDQRRLSYIEVLLKRSGAPAQTARARAQILYWAYLGFVLSDRPLARKEQDRGGR